MLRRLRHKASKLLRRGWKRKDIASFYSSDSPSLPSRQRSSLSEHFTGGVVDASVDPNAAAYSGKAHLRDTDIVKSKPQVDITGVAPEPECSAVMASSAVARGYYRPVSASILDDFEPKPEQGPSNSIVPQSTRLQSVRSGPKTQILRAQPGFRYRATNPAILDDFGESLLTTSRPSQGAASDAQIPGSSSETNVNRGYRPPSQAVFSDFNEKAQPERQRLINGDSRPTQTGPAQEQPPSTSASASTTLLGSNNPYADLVRSRQNAMTTDFPPSQDQVASGELPPFAGDENR